MQGRRVFSRFGAALNTFFSAKKAEKNYAANLKLWTAAVALTMAGVAANRDLVDSPAYAESPTFIPVATRNSIEEGKVYEYIVNDGVDRVAVAFVNGKFYCVSGFCPHFKAQLAAGIVDKATICCPWHGCRYCLKTGKRLEGPSHHNIRTFDVVVDEEGTVFVSVPRGATVPKNVTPVPPPKQRVQNDKTVLIVGAGASGMAAADALREYGFGGKVIVVGEESHLPYDRTILSKNPKCKVEKLALRSKDELSARGIELVSGQKVNEIIGKDAVLSNGEKIAFDNLIVATGRQGGPTLNVEGVREAANVIHFKSYDDLAQLRRLYFPYCKVVIIGQNSVACELGSSLRKLDCDVTILTDPAGPLCAEGSIRIRDSVATVLRNSGVKFIYGRSINSVGFSKYPTTRVEGKLVDKLEMSDGEALQADIVIVTDQGKVEGLKVDGKVVGADGWAVDDRLVSLERSDIRAVGDCALIPSDLMDKAFKQMTSTADQKVLYSPHSWSTAIDTGRAAARDILGLPTLRELGELERTILTEEDKQKLTKISTSHVPLYSVFVDGHSYRFTGLDGTDLKERIHPVDLKVEKRPPVGPHGIPSPFILMEGDAKKKFRFTGWVFRAGGDGVLGAVSGGVDPAAVGIRELMLKGALPPINGLLLGVFNARTALNLLQEGACLNGEIRKDAFKDVLPSKQEAVEFVTETKKETK